MAEGRGLLVLVPSRGRPHTVAEMARAFYDTCGSIRGGEYTKLLFVIDNDDPAAGDYLDAVATARKRWAATYLFPQPGGSMVAALNAGLEFALDKFPDLDAVGFMGDDHRPRSEDWDRTYLDTLRTVPGMTFGDDLIKGLNLPTQIAMSAEIVRALGHMAPPPLTHMYVDNYWLQLGREARCITYLPDVVVEHLHPSAGTAEWDEGYRRVNDPAMFARDLEAADKYWTEHGPRDVAAVRKALLSLTPSP